MITPSNKITKIHTRNQKLYIYCQGDKLVEKTDDTGYIANKNNNIKEKVNGNDIYKDIKLEFPKYKELKVYENVIFSIDSDTDIQFDWGNTGDIYNYLLILSSTKNIQDIDIENIEGSWNWDDTLIKNTNFQRELNILKSNRQLDKVKKYDVSKDLFGTDKNGYKFNFSNVKINFSDDRASYFVLNIESKLVTIDVEIEEINRFILNHEENAKEVDNLNIKYINDIDKVVNKFDEWKLIPREDLNNELIDKFNREKKDIEEKENNFIKNNEELDDKIRNLIISIEEVKEEKKIYFENLEKEQDLLKKPIIVKGGEE